MKKGYYALREWNHKNEYNVSIQNVLSGIVFIFIFLLEI